METLAEAAQVQDQVIAWKRQGFTVGFVPTMGFLHAGHTSLMDVSARRCDKKVVSIFVNPLQFEDEGDLDRYPSAPEADAATCAEHGTDLLFTPASLYPPGFASSVRVSGLTDGLCGATRPGHFDGVTTVVARLFGIVQPDVAVFGEKDYQQLAVIRRMVQDLALPIEVVGGSLVRDADGLALSSRNAHLQPKDRTRATSLSRALFAMAASQEGEVTALLALGKALLDVDRLDYLTVVDAESLEPLHRVEGEARALVAAYVGETRLIDNVAL